MKLTDLSPKFYRYETRLEERDFVVGDQKTWRDRGCPTEKRVTTCVFYIPVATLAEAQCVWFLCPKCFAENQAKLTPDQREDPEAAGVGIHSVSISLEGRGVKDNEGTHNSKGEAVRWSVEGTDFSNLTLRPSILNECGCKWHGFITNGEVTSC